MNRPSVDLEKLQFEASNLDKEIYPDAGLTKGDLMAYAERAADAILPHLRGRPLVLRRFPDGIEEPGFFQKEASDHFPDWVRTVEVPLRTERRTVRHVVCDDAETLLYLVDQAVVELHAWLAPADRLEYPDRMVFDLDPSGDVEVEHLRAAARRVAEALDDLGLVPFVQGTGGRGFHVLTPLDGSTDDRAVLRTAQEIARRIERDDPTTFTTEARRADRGDRIYLDVARNSYGQTAVTAYSPRARPGAPVAAPLDWAELSRARPAAYDVTSMPRRLAHKSDPWADLGGSRRSLTDVRAALDLADARSRDKRE